METEKKNDKVLSFANKINFCVGNLGLSLMTGIVTGFALIFMTDTVGLNSGIVATLISISMIFDSITDLSFGSMLAKTKTKMGMARPWFLGSIIPICLCETLIFFVPQTSNVVQYVYFFIFYVLMNAVCRTVSSISYDTMSIRITNIPQERVSVCAIKSIFGTFLGLVQTSFTLSLCTAFGGGIRGWRIVAILFSLVGGLLMVYTGLTSKELPAEELDGAEPEVKEIRSVFKEIVVNYKILFTSKFAVMMVFLAMSTVLMTGAAATVASYYAVWVLGNEDLMVVVTICMMAPMIISYFFTPILVKKMGLYRANWITMSIACVFAILSLITGYAGITVVMFACIALRSLFAGLYGATQNALVAEIGEYSYLKDGVHMEGVIFGCVSFGNKIGGSIIMALCGWLLAAAGYDGTASSQTPAALGMITFLFIGVPALFIVVDALILKSMNIAEKKEALLAERNKAEVEEN